MNILFITIAWPVQDEKNLYSDLMYEFVANGHNVFVVAASNNYMKNSQTVKKENGISIIRLNSGKISKASYFRKSLSLLMLGSKIYSAIEKEFSAISIDIIIGHTPPITLSSVYKKLKKKYSASFYLLLRDIWPQGSVDHKVINKYSLPWIYLRGHEIRIYKAADFIGCMSPLGVDYLSIHNRYLDTNKVEVCPNSIKPSEHTPFVDMIGIRDRYNIPTNACVFIFSGNLSKGHGLYFLVESIRRLANYDKAFFLIGGSGTHYTYLENEFRKLHLRNASLYRRLPLGDFKQLMLTSDVGLILLDKCYTVPQFPSRLLTYLDYAKPVLCAVNEGTDIGMIVERNHCGISLIHGDHEKFIYAVKVLAENEDLRLQMGLNSRKLLETEYSVVRSYKTIMDHFV